MKYNLIISAHCDDSIFSMGSYIQTLENVVSISPFDGIPKDEKGERKHTILNAEHKEACSILDVEIISGKFLDDVYHETRLLFGMSDWFKDILSSFNDYTVYVPLGIHHPDHVIVRDIFVKHFRIDYFYSELPYRIRYPYLYENLKMILLSNMSETIISSNILKEIAVRKYVSQTDEEVIRDIMVDEIIWH